jgi:hypothetical protein
MTYTLSGVNFTNQDDIVPLPGSGPEAITNSSSAYSLGGNDQIIGKGFSSNVPDGLFNSYSGTIDTGNGRDTITGSTWDDYYGRGIYNEGSIETGNDEDYISTYGNFGYNFGYYGITYGKFENYGMVSLGDGNDVLEAMVNVADQSAILNLGTIEAGNGDDLIFSNTTIYNEGLINTGNGRDSLIAHGGFYLVNNGNISNGKVFLGDGEDYLKGFGNGYYEGGNAQDSLELPSGCYTIDTINNGVESGLRFTRTFDGHAMPTFGFEKLIVGTTTYDFTSLYDGQTICG